MKVLLLVFLLLQNVLIQSRHIPSPTGGSAVGLIDEWPINEGTGTVFHDLVPVNPTDINTAIAGAGTWGAVTGFLPTPFQFAGVIPGPSAHPLSPNYDLGGNTPFSVCGWIRSAAFGAGQDTIVSTSNRNLNFTGWELNVTAGSLQFFAAQSSPGNILAVQQNATLATSTTQQVCAAYDGSKLAAGVDLYVSGSVVASSTVVDTFTGNSNSPIIGIGIRTASVSADMDPFPGTIGFVSVWGCKLSSTVIAANNAVGHPSFTGLHC